MKKTKSICIGAVIAALYVALTLVNPISWASMQFRVSNILCVVPLVNKKIAPGILVGIAISNAFSPLGLVDVLFGVLAEGVAYALCVYGPLNKISLWKKAAILSLSVSMIIGAELTLAYSIPYFVNVASLFVSTSVILGIGVAVFSKGPMRSIMEKI